MSQHHDPNPQQITRLNGVSQFEQRIAARRKEFNSQPGVNNRSLIPPSRDESAKQVGQQRDSRSDVQTTNSRRVHSVPRPSNIQSYDAAPNEIAPIPESRPIDHSSRPQSMSLNRNPNVTSSTSFDNLSHIQSMSSRNQNNTSSASMENLSRPLSTSAIGLQRNQNNISSTSFDYLSRPQSMSLNRNQHNISSASMQSVTSEALPHHFGGGIDRAHSFTSAWNPPEDDDEPVLSFDLHAETRTKAMRSRPSFTSPQQTSDDPPKKKASFASSQTEDGDYPDTIQGLREELKKLRDAMTVEGDKLNGLRSHEAAARASLADGAQQGATMHSRPEDTLAKLKRGLNESEEEEAKLRDELLQAQHDIQDARRKKIKYLEAREALMSDVQRELSALEGDGNGGEFGGDEELIMKRAVGNLVHRKNMAIEDLEKASHDLAILSDEVPLLNAAARDARTRYTDEVQAAKKSMEAERARMDEQQTEEEKRRRDEEGRLQERAREYIRVADSRRSQADAADMSGIDSVGGGGDRFMAAGGGSGATFPNNNNRSFQSAALSHTLKPPVAWSIDSGAGSPNAKRPTLPSSSSTSTRHPVKKRVPSATQSRVVPSAAVRSVSATSTTVDGRKPFVVANKHLTYKPARSMPPHLGGDNSTGSDIGGGSYGGYGGGGGGYGGGGGGRAPSLSPQVVRPTWVGGGQGGSGYEGPFRDGPDLNYRQPSTAPVRFMTPSHSTRAPLPHQRHLLVETPPHPSSLVVKPNHILY